jgi:hypothetical protein
MSCAQLFDLLGIFCEFKKHSSLSLFLISKFQVQMFHFLVLQYQMFPGAKMHSFHYHFYVENYVIKSKWKQQFQFCQDSEKLVLKNH